MNSIARQLAAELYERLLSETSVSRILVGLCGVPASGKSTLGPAIVREVNALARGAAHSTNHEVAVCVGLDGWHLSRSQLNEMPNAAEAHEKRGIHWTFDGQAFVDFVARLKEEPITEVISAPSFDHSLKDPTPDGLTVHPYHRLILLEGLYVYLGIPPWIDGGRRLDERWFLEVDGSEARNRLIARHVETGVTPDEREAQLRADGSDIPNGQFVIENMLPPTKTIKSIHDPTLSPFE